MPYEILRSSRDESDGVGSGLREFDICSKRNHWRSSFQVLQDLRKRCP